MSKLTYHIASRPYPGKNHDTSYISPDETTFAVFDGAGQDVASKLARSAFEQRLRSPNTTLTQEDRLAGIFRDTQSFLLKSLGSGALTTATALSLRSTAQGWSAAFAHAGDSRLYAFTPQSNELRRLTVDESERMPNGRIDAHNFLGSSYHILRQLGTCAMPTDTRFLLLTDGLVDDYYEGHVTDDRIAEILSTAATPQTAVRELQAACTVPDDATAIAVFGHK